LLKIRGSTVCSGGSHIKCLMRAVVLITGVRPHTCSIDWKVATRPDRKLAASLRHNPPIWSSNPNALNDNRDTRPSPKARSIMRSVIVFKVERRKQTIGSKLLKCCYSPASSWSNVSNRYLLINVHANVEPIHQLNQSCTQDTATSFVDPF